MKNPAAVALGRRGGLALKAKRPKDYFKELGKKRWKKKLKTNG